MMVEVHAPQCPSDDFSIRNLAQVLETQAESSRAMALLLAAVASVSLMVGGIGIMNIRICETGIQ